MRLDMPRRGRGPLAVLVPVFSILWLAPLAWTVASGLRPGNAVFRSFRGLDWRTFVPDSVTAENVAAIADGTLGRAIVNSLIVAGATVAVGVLMSAMAAYGLTAFRFRGRGFVFAVVVLAFMVPFEALAIPLADSARSVGLDNSYIGLILPGVGNGLAIFLPLAVIAAAGAWFIATGVNRSVSRLQRATRRIADGDLDFELDARGNSELASLARSFDAMRGALKEETERRSRLLAAVTHDVKTPLTAIKGYLEAIADGMAEDRETRDRYLGIIAEKADLLGGRVSELIEYVRLSSSQWHIEPVPTGLAAFHRELCDGIAGDAAVLKRRLRQELRIPERLTAPMDAALLSRAYENILDNALRFTPEDGTVTVSAAVVDSGDLEVRIADSGPGIAAEDLPHLFDPFYRGAGTSSGFGLGLSIARSITDAHGFSLDVDSRKSPGTTFVIRVPARLISAGAGQHRIMSTEVIPTDVQHAAAGVEPATVSKDLRAAPSAADLASTPSAGLRG